MIGALLVCTVVAVADGDTLSARCRHEGRRVELRVRVADIDAPEAGQRFGGRSRQALRALCLRREALLRPRETDRFGRTVATVECAGSDAGRTLVREGLAWAAAAPGGLRPYAALEREARAARRGLWHDAAPVPPWRWRAANPR